MTHRKSQPRGIAMVIVLILVAMATVMSYALLSSQSIMVQAGSNGARSAQADALAESGIQLASYYLQNPTAAPILNSSGYYPGQTGVSLGSALDGTVDITVTMIDAATYDIASRSHFGSASTTPMNRSLGARATVQYAYAPPEAMTVNSNLSVTSGMTINGEVRSKGNVTLAVGAAINGKVYAPSVTGSLTKLIGSIITTSNSGNGSQSDPTPTTIKDYRTYTYNGKTYSAQVLPNGGSANKHGPTTNNPLGVYYADGDVTITAGLTIEGTLLVPSGKLIVKSPGLIITPAANMPGLVVKSDVAFSGTNRALTVNGLSWIGGTLTKSGTASNSKTIFNGAVQFAGGSTPVASAYSGTVVINYDKTLATVKDFIPGQGTVPYGVTLASFSNK